MMVLKLVLVILGIGLFGSAGALVVYDVVVAEQLRRLLRRSAEFSEGVQSAAALVPRPFGPVQWRRTLQLAGLGALPLLISQSIAVAPDEATGVRVSQIWGARPGTLYAGVHIVTPLIETREVFAPKREELRT